MAATLISQTGILRNLVDLKEKVVQRLASSSNFCDSFDCEETIWERGTQGNGAEENFIRFRSTRTAQTRIDSIHVLQAPESIRLQPEFLVRTTIDLIITSDQPQAFVSALGYRKKFTLYKRGIEFKRGTVKAELYQLFQDAQTLIPLDPTSFILVISASVPEKSATNENGVEISSQQLIEVAKERIRELRGVVRGLVDKLEEAIKLRSLDDQRTAKENYDTRWKSLSAIPPLSTPHEEIGPTPHPHPLSFSSFPWPIYPPIPFPPLSWPQSADITPAALAEFIFPSKNPNFEGKKKLLRGVILLYHPDRFDRLLFRIREEGTRERVRELGLKTSQTLNDLLKEI